VSIKIIKAGIADSFQDLGRYGFQHLGINPNGAMDIIAAQVANMLVGNDVDDAVIELHFPASIFLFQQQALIALSGADFTAMINDEYVPINTPIVVEKNCVLQFKKLNDGARCYLAIKGGWQIEKQLNSYSTNTKANFGGHFGRFLQKDDNIRFNDNNNYARVINKHDSICLHWKADVKELYHQNAVRVIKGIEFEELTSQAKNIFTHNQFKISPRSDRMGYRLRGEKLSLKKSISLISSAVTKGTIQLLPDEQMILLMADHQTTGGYPRIAHVIAVDISSLAQKQINQVVSFTFIEEQEAEDIFIKQQQYLHQLQNACTLRLKEFLSKHDLH
jgi:antagonist of KipI